MFLCSDFYFVYKMYDVNWEKGSGVCRGCLSSDRRLSPLFHSELYATLLNKNQKDMDTSVVLFCWECAAFMRRMYLFQLQTQKADKMLSESLETFLIKKSLSSLIISHKHDYDAIIEEKYDTSDKLDICDIDIKEEESQKEENSENSRVDKIEEHDSDGAGRLDLDLKVSSDEENTRNAENAIIKTINEQSRKRKHEIDTIEFVSTSLLTKRRSERIKYVTAKQNLKALKKTKLKTVKRKNKHTKRKYVHTNLESEPEATPVDIKIKNEMEIDLSKSIPCLSSVAGNSNKNKYNEKSSTTQETDNPDVHTDTIPNENLKSESSDGDSNTEDPDYFEEKYYEKVETAPKIDKSRNRRKYSLIQRVIFRYTYDQLDEYFSQVQVADETIEAMLKSEPKYTTEEKPFGCQYCGRCFEVKRQLVHHIQTRHKQIRKAMSIKDPNSPLYYRFSMYRCNICDKVLRKEHDESHMKYLHRIQYTCTECDATFWERSDAEEHQRTSHKTFTCNICNAVKSRKRYLDNHIQTWHTPVTCDDCGEQFEMRKMLLKHREDKHPDSNPELRYCVQCNIQFRSVFAYQSHLRYTKAHRTGQAETFPCSECAAVLTTKNSLECHRDRLHRGKTRFQCPHCGKFYGRKNGLQNHIASAHLKVPKPKDKICSYCGRGFSNNRILKFHIRTHTGERPYQCTYCNAAFAQPFPLKKHLATVHKHATDTHTNVNTAGPHALENDSNSRATGQI